MATTEQVEINHLVSNWSSNVDWGYGVFESKHPEAFYKQHGPPFLVAGTACHQENVSRDARYTRWMDRNGLIRSGNNYGVEALVRKRDEHHRGSWPYGFDHTTQWRFKGASYPLVILTEPYDLPRTKDRDYWDMIAQKYNLLYKVYEPSDKSLWYPDQTYMVFWWAPGEFDFDEDMLMGHETADEVEKLIDYKLIRRKQGT